MEKTIYIIGAGFSKGVRHPKTGRSAPSQEELVDEIFNIHESHPEVFSAGKIDKFKSFLTDTLSVEPEYHHKIPLEDLFTPIDRCISDNISFRDKSLAELKEIRELIYYLIGKTMRYLLEGTEKGYIDDFARMLVEQSSVRAGGKYKKTDPVTAISTNWDILLDQSIKSAIDRNYSGKAVVDYGCNITSFKEGDDTIKPGLEMLASGGFNVKLLKLHGSLNWLQCPRCLRLYVDFDSKIAVDQYINRRHCRHCDEHFGRQPSHELTSILIMPTFLKNLSNPQYRLLWQNAGIELAEAAKLVFIGYSLPHADFEMRQLLSRMTRANAKIEVVDYDNGNKARIAALEERYKIFFGNRPITFHYGGAKQYIDSILEKAR